MKHTIIGAGDYGAGLVTNLHLNGHLPSVSLDSYVDINPNMEELQTRPVWQSPGIEILIKGVSQRSAAQKIPLYQQLDDWLRTRKDQQLSQYVVDLALTADYAPKVLQDYLEVGVKNFVLPKPFTFNSQIAQEALNSLQRQKAKTAVASNWFYSDITQKTKQLLDTLTKQYSVDRVELDYSCKGQDIRSPVHDELPHAIQILASTGLINPEKSEPTVTLAETCRISTQYQSLFNNAPIQVNSFLDQAYNTTSKRKRELRIYLNDGDAEPDVIVNYDVLFNRSGQLQKPGSIAIDLPDRKENEFFPENTMAKMYNVIFNAMQKKPADFEKDKTILRLQSYLPIIKQLEKIEKQWSSKVIGEVS